MALVLYKSIENYCNEKIKFIHSKSVFFLKNNYLFFFVFFASLWIFCTFYPGTIAYDSFSVYEAAYYNQVGNWHSALLTRFWQCILFITDNRSIFWLLQLVSISTGLYVVGKHISKGILTGIICSSILFIPPVFGDLVVVVKDTYLAAFTFLIGALLFDTSISNTKRTRIFYVICILILIFCFYLRSNGCFIAAPLLVAICLGWKKQIIYRYITCLVLVLCVVATTSFVDLKLFRARDEAPDFSLMLFDLIGTAKNSGQLMLPSIPDVPDQETVIEHCYTPLQWDTIAHWAEKDKCNVISAHYFNKRDESVTNFNEARAELRKAWVSAILQHPSAYLKHRLTHFNYFINYLGHDPVYRSIYTTVLGFVDFGDKEGPLTYKKRPPKFWTNFIHRDLEHQLWFHPYVSLLILLFFYLATLATSDRFNRTLNVVAFSGMIYLVGFLFVGVSGDFRYSYPSLLLSILCILAAFGYYSQKREVFGTKKTRIIAASVTIPLFLIGIIL